MSRSGPPVGLRPTRLKPSDSQASNIFRFCLRIKDGTGEADVRLFGAEAEKFLGVSADMFARYKKVRVRLQKVLEESCGKNGIKKPQAPAPASASAFASGPSTVTYWRSGDGQDEDEDKDGDEDDDGNDDESSINDDNGSTPLINFKLFSYQPESAPNRNESVILAVYGTVL